MGSLGAGFGGMINPFKFGKVFSKSPKTPDALPPEEIDRSQVDPNLDEGIAAARKARVGFAKKSGRGGLRVDLGSGGGGARSSGAVAITRGG